MSEEEPSNENTFGQLIKKYNKISQVIFDKTQLLTQKSQNINNIDIKIIKPLKDIVLKDIVLNNVKCKDEINIIYNQCREKIDSYKYLLSNNINININQKNRIILVIRNELFSSLQKMYKKSIICIQNGKKYIINNIEIKENPNTQAKFILLQLVYILHELLPPFKRKEVLNKLKKSKKDLNLKKMNSTINKIVREWISL